MRTAIVLTTINIPVALGSYIENCQKYKHTDVIFIVVGDLRTPQGAKEYVEGLSGAGLNFVYLTPLEQERFLRLNPRLAQ